MDTGAAPELSGCPPFWRDARTLLPSTVFKAWASTWSTISDIVVSKSKCEIVGTPRIIADDSMYLWMRRIFEKDLK